MSLWKIHDIPIYGKLIGAFLVVIVPMYAIGWAMNESARSSVQHEIVESMETNVHFYLSSFETDMNRLIQLKRQYAFDADFQKLSALSPAMSDYERVLSILRVQNKIALMKDSNTFIAEVKVYMHQLQRTITTQSFDGPLAADEVNAIRQYPDNYGSPFIYWRDQLLLSEVYPYTQFRNDQPLLAIEIQLSEPAIVRSLQQINKYSSSSGTMLLDVQQMWSIDSGGEGRVVAGIKQFLQQPQYRDVPAGHSRMNVDGAYYLVTFETSPLLNTTLVEFVPEDQVLGRLNAYRIRFWILSALSVFIISLVSYWIYRLIHKPLHRLVRAFRKVEDGELGVSLVHRNRDEFRYLYQQFNEMTDRLRFLVHEVYEQQIRSQRAELKLLQSQISPHFLYNTYYLLHRMAQLHDTGNVIRYTRYLGDYFHFITRSHSDEVPLAAEFKHAIAYIEIQKMRFAGRITVETDPLPEPCGDWPVPRLILQPILENAFHHGLEQMESGGKLAVRMSLAGDLLRLSIEDNGDSLTDEDIGQMQKSLEAPLHSGGETTSTINVHRRLQFMFGSAYGIAVARSAWNGLRVTFNIPKKG